MVISTYSNGAVQIQAGWSSLNKKTCPEVSILSQEQRDRHVAKLSEKRIARLSQGRVNHEVHIVKEFWRLKVSNSRFALDGLAPFLPPIHGLYTVFQAPLDTCLDSPLLRQPLSPRFALHGLRAFDCRKLS